MQNKIYIISGPSGIGKGTIEEALVKDKTLNLYWAKSYTTRAPRESDKTENKYIFTNKEKFKELEKSGEIFESNFYNDNWYGSSRLEIEKALENGQNVIKDVDVNGGKAYRQFFPDAVQIFIIASLENIKSRLVERGQNTPEEIEERLETAKKELEYQSNYDFVVENPEGHPEKAIEAVADIIKKETNA